MNVGEAWTRENLRRFCSDGEQQDSLDRCWGILRRLWKDNWFALIPRRLDFSLNNDAIRTGTSYY